MTLAVKVALNPNTTKPTNPHFRLSESQIREESSILISLVLFQAYVVDTY